jgi:hypothetical protein
MHFTSCSANIAIYLQQVMCQLSSTCSCSAALDTRGPIAAHAAGHQLLVLAAPVALIGVVLSHLQKLQSLAGTALDAIYAARPKQDCLWLSSFPALLT